jgi:pimeloyl-ACP methyl ester carboxylesterase
MQYIQQSDAAIEVLEQSMSPPHPLLLALEARAPWELAALFATSPWLKRLARGDGHPVLVLPGLGANDWSTAPIRAFLKELGYKPYPWEQGLNLGPRAGVIDACEHRLECIFEHHQRPVSLLGWSLGGVYAREIAKANPQWVRSVITLGSPFSGNPKATKLWRVYEWLSGHKTDTTPDLLRQLRQPPAGVPTTSIFSRSDGVVSWKASVNPRSPLAENIVIPSSHIGLGFNPLALMAVADRLAQSPGQWQPFEPKGLSALLLKTHP